MTYEQAFAKIKEGLKDADTSKLTGNFAIQVDLINKDCAGAFYVSYFDGLLGVEPYDYVDNAARIGIMYGDFNKLVSGKLNVQKAIEAEKITVTGDAAKVEELTTLVKKAPAKKTVKAAPEKKAEEKKPAAKKTEKTEPVKKTVAKKTEKAETEKKTAAKKTAKK